MHITKFVIVQIYIAKLHYNSLEKSKLTLGLHCSTYHALLDFFIQFCWNEDISSVPVHNIKGNFVIKTLDTKEKST